ncbi:hypothetical protein LINPERHAP1_LOCUS37949 [Linum perenne]
MGRSDIGGTPRTDVSIAWDPGPPDWLVLNTDGSVITSSGTAAAGGLVRDEWGRCLLAFSSKVGSCSITRAELRGIATGLNEGNRSADFLANLGHTLPLGTHRIPISDCNLGYFIRLDCMGISEPRSIIVTT